VPDVIVEASKITEIIVAMVEDTQELQEVVVTGIRDMNTDVSMISAIRESKLVVTGISAQQISMSQDRDAAQVVKRVPGVTLQDNRFVIVRGLASRYSSVMLNGVLAPSTEADTRAFSFDIIPSGSIDRMLVYKSGSAELPGDFAGSVIQVSTKSATDENFINFGFTGGYRVNTSFSNQNSQQRSATEWLGFDNGMRDLPANAPDDIRSIKDPAQIDAMSRQFANTWGLEEISVKPDVRFNLDIGRNFTIGNFEVSSINALSYSNTNQFNEFEFNRYQNYNSDFTSEYRFRYKDEQFTNNVRVGILSNWSLKLNHKNRIEFRNLYNRLGTTQTTIREGANYFQTQYYRNYSLRYIERSIYSGQIEGKHDLTNNKSKVSWILGYTSASRQEPDWKRLTTARGIDAAEETPFVVAIPSSTSPAQAARFYQDLGEYNLTHRLDYSYKLHDREELGSYELKTGYWVEYKDRNFSARQIGHVIRDGFDQEIAALPYDQIFASQYVGYHGGHFIAENSKETDSYNATNLLAAGYLTVNMPVSKKFMIIPGVRIEHNIQKLETVKGNGERLVDNPITTILPYLNIAYNLNSSSLVRMAYSKTINRPEFREIAPFSFYDFDNQADILGNPNLKTANIHNVDIRWEYYPTPSEFISFGTFFKYFDNPIETNIKNGADNAVFEYNNADNAQNYGVEIEIRKSLAYSSASKFLNNTSAVFNASYIISEINLVDNGTLQEKSSRPMQGQSPYIINAGLSYDDQESGLQASIQYNVFGKRIAFVGNPGTPTWWEMPRQLLDLTISKRISTAVDLKLGVSDLLNAKSFIREDANLDNKVGDDETNRIIRSTTNGQYITLGVSVKL
jgi:TonB-dependent receptor